MLETAISKECINKFWKFVISDHKDKCWPWLGFINSEGYGAFWLHQREFKAHRLSRIIHFGPIPKGLIVCHSCDIRHCVNPYHLFIGTIGDNNRDRAAKGRSAKPIWCISKLTEEQKKDVLNKYNNGISQRRLAQEYNVSQRLIWNIINPEKLLLQRLKYGK